MNPTISELIQALPEDEAGHTTADDQLRDLLSGDHNATGKLSFIGRVAVGPHRL